MKKVIARIVSVSALLGFAASVSMADIPIVHKDHEKGKDIHQEITNAANAPADQDFKGPGLISCVVGKGCTLKPSPKGEASNKKKTRDTAGETH